MRFYIFTKMIILKTETGTLFYLLDVLQIFHKNSAINYNFDDFEDRIRIEKKLQSKGENIKIGTKEMSKRFTNLQLRLRMADEEFYGQL